MNASPNGWVAEMRRLPGRAGGVLSYFTRHRTAANLLLVIMLVIVIKRQSLWANRHRLMKIRLMPQKMKRSHSPLIMAF